MEIFGVGGMELVAILIIMLVVAGPKRMVQWAYMLGQYVAKFRTMWSEVMAGVQKELDAAGMDVKLPQTMPTRADLNKQILNTMNPATNVWASITAPVQDVMTDVSTELHEAVQEEKVVS